MIKSKFKPEELETVKDLCIKYGGPYVASVYGCRVDAVYKFLKKNGVPPITPNHYRTDITVETVAELKKQGLSFQKIGRKLGCSEYCARKRFYEWKEKYCINGGTTLDILLQGKTFVERIQIVNTSYGYDRDAGVRAQFSALSEKNILFDLQFTVKELRKFKREIDAALEGCEEYSDLDTVAEQAKELCGLEGEDVNIK